MLVVCAGTGTEIGKTWVGAAVCRELLARGRTVSARKPAQSSDPADPHPTDAEVLGGATGEDPFSVCPPARWYGVAMAPPMAASALRTPPFTLADLVADLRWPDPIPDVRWIETAGGVRSPLADDGDNADLCTRVAPDLVVLVADAGLGTINAVRLCLTALAGHTAVVLLNRFDPLQPLHRANRAWLTERDRCQVVTSVAELLDRFPVV